MVTIGVYRKLSFTKLFYAYGTGKSRPDSPIICYYCLIYNLGENSMYWHYTLSLARYRKKLGTDFIVTHK